VLLLRRPDVEQCPWAKQHSLFANSTLSSYSCVPSSSSPERQPVPSTYSETGTLLWGNGDQAIHHLYTRGTARRSSITH
jgi:hypothetical protein